MIVSKLTVYEQKLHIEWYEDKLHIDQMKTIQM